MEIGAYVTGMSWLTRPEAWTWQQLKSAWLEVESLGYDYCWTMDNVVGALPFEPEVPVFDTWTILGAIADATHRIKFGTMVTPYGRRRPAVIAKSSSVLDVISDGRFQLGMGPGDEPQQHEPWGQPYPAASERIAILREELEIIKRMWTEEHASFEGKHYTIQDAVNNPKPVQQPYPPIWLGIIFGRKLMPRLAAEYADGINIWIGEDAQAVDRLDLVAGHCKDLGRDFGEIKKSRTVSVGFAQEEVDIDAAIERRAGVLGVPVENLAHQHKILDALYVGPPEGCAEAIRKRTADLGFDQILLTFNSLGDFSDQGDASGYELEMNLLRTFAKEVMPALQAS